MATPTHEAQWVLRAQCHDRQALELLLRSVQRPLRRYIAGLVGADDADDILQDVLLLVSRKLYWLEQPELFRAWAFRIASRASFRHLKKRKRWSDATVDGSALEEIAAPDTTPPDDTMLELLDSGALSPASRAVLVLHFREDRSKHFMLLAIAALFFAVLFTFGFLLAHARDTGGNAKMLFGAAAAQMAFIGGCAVLVSYHITRMTRTVLNAIELLRK